MTQDEGLDLDPETAMPGFKRLPFDSQAMIKSLCKPRKKRVEGDMVRLKQFIKNTDFW